MGRVGTKKRNTWIIVVLIIIVGAIVAFGVYNYLKEQRQHIFLFTDDFKAGTQINKDMFVAEEIASNTYNAMAENGNGAMYVTSGEITEYIKAGDRLATDVVKMQPATSNLFISSGGSRVESRLSDDMVAVEILASRAYGLSGKEVRVGSRVNISTNYSYDRVKQTDLILQDVLVLDVVDDEDGQTMSIFVEVKPEDSVILQHALVSETVSVAVLRPGAYTPIKGAGTTYSKVYDVEDTSGAIDDMGFVEGQNGSAQ